MPTPKRPRPTKRGASSNGRGRGAVVSEGLPSPEEVAAIQASVFGKEQAPSTRQSAGANVDWARIRDQLGDPFDVERIPISRLRMMRRDPMLAFGLSFIKTPFARAQWHIQASDRNGPNPQVAANVDWALRRIYSSYVFQWSNILDFGFQAIAKRWEQNFPSGTYLDKNPDTGEITEQPLWSEGNIPAIVFKPFVALPPEVVEPMWTSQGDFNGILYKAGGAVGGTGSSQGSDKNEFKIDTYHALWATHGKDENFNSIFGFPRTGYAYRFWWSYWYQWAMYDQAFERKADPAVIVRHPEGDVDNGDGSFTPMREYALEMGMRMRSGATIAFPSDVYVSDVNGTPSSVRMWDIEIPEDMIDFAPFQKSFEYVDVMKLRALWIPEQAFLEGKGGTSSRNVAKEMGQSFTESQAVLASQLVETINRWIIPQFLATNFSEFMLNGGEAKMVMQGFADQDTEARNAIINLIGQQDLGSRQLMKIVDLEKVMSDAGIPLLSYKDQLIKQKEIEKEQALLNPPVAPGGAPADGETGVVPTATGFSYVAGREVIYLSDSSSKFIEQLPAAPQYSDSDIRREARILWNDWHDHYDSEYKSFASFLEEMQDEGIQLADVPDNFLKAARALVRRWQQEAERQLDTVTARTKEVFKRIARRAADVEARRAGVEKTPTAETLDEWVEEHTGGLVASVEFTTREELTDFLAQQMADGITDPKELASAVKRQFADYPEWKADRLARTETREAFNASVLQTARANGVKQVRAVDGHGDPECKDRDGKLFDLDAALKEKEHPNGTLAWQIPAVTLTWEYDDELPEGHRARMDAETKTVYFSRETDPHEREMFMAVMAETL